MSAPVLTSMVDRDGEAFKANAAHNRALVEQLRTDVAKAAKGGSEGSRQRHVDRGKLLPRDRVERLLDPGSPFLEIGQLAANGLYGKDDIPGAGVIAGIGHVSGRQCMIVCNDATVKGGTYYPMTVKKHLRAQEIAEANRLPCIYLVDSGGANLPHQAEVFPDRDHFGRIFYNQAQMSSQGIAQIACVMGSCTAGGAYVPAMADESVIVRNQGTIFLGGPPLVKAATGEVISAEELGGAKMHSRTSGVAHGAFENDVEMLMRTRALMSYLPLSNREPAPVVPCHDPIDRPSSVLDAIIPDNTNTPYDMRRVVLEIVDNGEFFEIHENFASNIIVGFGRIDGRTVGIVGNQPMVLAGCLDINASRKAARFVRFCDAFNIPLVTLVDVPGFMPGLAQETGGIISNGAKLLFAYAEATVPKVTLITRKAYGGAYDVMASKHLRGDVNYAWPSAEIAVMGPEGAARIIFREDAADPEKLAAKTDEYREKFANPFVAAGRGYLDDIIMPRNSRRRISRALSMLADKQLENPPRKHDNLPL